MATEELIVSNLNPKAAAESLSDKPFTVYIHVNTEGGIEINADSDAKFYSVIGAIEGARALMRCCVIDGYNEDKKRRLQESESNATKSID